MANIPTDDQHVHYPKLNRCSIAVYCAVVVSAFMAWVAGSSGLGPIDDHHFMRTIFQGKEFGFYIMPDRGRFFPLTAQEYVLAAKIFGPSAEMFYHINSSKIVLCGGLLYFCLALTGLGNFGLAILWTGVIFSMGIANTLFRLSAGEFNALILMLLFTWCALMLRKLPESAKYIRAGWAITGTSAFFLSLFYKELIFIFGLIFGLSEFARAYMVKHSRPSILVVSTLLSSVVYIVFYGIWRHIYVTGSYVDFHSTSAWNVLTLFAINDPIIILIGLPVAVYRIFTIFFKPEYYSIYDSLLFASSAYVGAFLMLSMYNTYYLLPAYAFTVCGLAGIISTYFRKISQHGILVLVFLFTLNMFPMAISDIQSQKLIAKNHFKFVTYFSKWFQENLSAVDGQRNIWMAGVSPGNGVEILVSMKIFLVSLGVPGTSFKVKATEPSDNITISNYHQFNSDTEYHPEVNDILVFNPYQQVVIRPPMQAPSYQEIFKSDQAWAIPRWKTWQWIKICLINHKACTVNISANMRYSGYAAMLVTRGRAPFGEIVQIKSGNYRIVALNLSTRMKSGSIRKINVLVQNTGEEKWPSDGSLRSGMYVNLAYRWFDENKRMLLEGDRTPLPEPMLPGDLAKISINLKAPVLPGKYKLVISPVQEGVAWFSGEDEYEIKVHN